MVFGPLKCLGLFVQMQTCDTFLGLAGKSLGDGESGAAEFPTPGRENTEGPFGSLLIVGFALIPPVDCSSEK